MLFALLVSSVASNLIGTLHPSHLNQYKNKLTTAAGLADLYYLTQFDTDLDVNWESACLVYKDFSSISNVNDLFYASEYLRSKTGQKCTLQLEAGDFAIATKALENPENLRVAYQAIVIEISRGTDLTAKGDDLVTKMVELVKKDDSVLAGSLALSAGVALWRQNSNLDLEPLLKVVQVEDLFAQADSFERQLSFDNDIAITYWFIKAALDVSEYKDNLALTNDQLIGFGNFVAVGYRPVTNQEVFYFINLVNTLTKNKWGSLVRADLATKTPYHQANKDIQVLVFDLQGRPIKASVVGRSITRSSDNEVILSNVKFNVVDRKEKLDPIASIDSKPSVAFVYNFMSASPSAGFYELELEVTGEGLLITDDAIRYKIKVVQPTAVKNIQYGIGSKKLGAKKLEYKEGTFPAGTEADVNSKLGVTFSVESLIDGKAIKVHQAFISLQNTASEVTTTFIAEADEKMLYTASFDVKDHMEFSGTYKVTLVVGDPIMHPGSVILPLGEVTITGLPESTVTGSWNRKYLEKYDKLPVLSHTFKEPEPRPPVTISIVFTGICAVPLLGLIVAWKSLGINVNKIQSSFIPFHLSIASIFGLYFLYWYKLNMFTTLKYLALLGSVTFILGNKVLSSLASNQK